MWRRLTWFHWHLNNLDPHERLQELFDAPYAALHMKVPCHRCMVQGALFFLSQPLTLTTLQKQKSDMPPRPESDLSNCQTKSLDIFMQPNAYLSNTHVVQPVPGIQL